jgi:hypothetical protein
MFIETVPNRGSPPAVLLRESYRDEQGRSQKRTLANLSKLPRDVIDTLKAVLKGATVVGTGPQELEVERSLPHGHVAAALGMIRKIGLDRLILSRSRDAASRRSCNLVLAMMVDRLIDSLRHDRSWALCALSMRRRRHRVWARCCGLAGSRAGGL